MWLSIALVGVFALLGLPLLPRPTPGRLLLAPVMGLAALVLLSYFISMNLHVNGANAMAAAIAILIFVLVLYGLHLRKNAVLGHQDFKNEIKPVLLALLPAFFLLTPAIQNGINNFFGAINFDYFYNSQDAWYLSTHTVRDFDPGTTNSILPLDWSANPQGRFAVSLIGAFFFKFFGAVPLHFNSSLISALVIIGAFTAYSFARQVLGLGFWFSGLACSAFILSGGFSQGYIYYLLGQISAIPLFLAVCIYSCNLLEELTKDISDRKLLLKKTLLIVFLLNALYVFYAILSFFALAFILLAAVLLGLKNKDFFLRVIFRTFCIFALTIAAFLFIRILSLSETKRALIDWIALSLKTAGPVASQTPVVFSEYITESFLSLLLGVFRYPTNASLFNNLLESGDLRNWRLICIGITALCIFLCSVLILVRTNNISRTRKSIVLALVFITIPSAILFFISQSGYAIFKIGSWLIPILLMVPVASIAYSNKYIWWLKAPMFLAFSSLILMNFLTATNYMYAFLPGIGLEKYMNSSHINGMEGVVQLKESLKNYPRRPLIFDLTDGIATAWIANEFREHPISALTHNFQPLEDRLIPNPSCKSNIATLPEDGILITDRRRENNDDIISITPEQSATFFNGKYATYRIAELKYYAFLGRGLYPAYSLPNALDQKTTGLPLTLRWVEKGAEIFVYSRRNAKIDIEFDVAPGYVLSPINRTIEISSKGINLHANFKKNETRMRFTSIPIPQGISCFFIESKDEVSSLDRYGALFREKIPMDARFLNFALGNIQIRFYPQ